MSQVEERWVDVPGGGRLFVLDTGPGSTGHTLVMSHGLLWSSGMFAPQIEHLRSRFRVVAWDHRGQGRSDEHEGRVVGMELCTDDALALFDRLGLGPVHFLGLSMGGFVGMRIAARWPDRIRSLALLETTAGPEPRKNVPRYTALNFVAERFGLGLVADRVMPIMFSRTTMTSPSRVALRATWKEKLRQNRPSIVRAVRGVIEREGVEHLLGRIAVPSLVVVGDEDVATTPDKARALAAGIPGAELVVIPGVGHTSTVEDPAAVNGALDAFYGRVAGG